MINLAKFIFSSWLLSTGNSLQESILPSNKGDILKLAIPPQITPSAYCEIPYSFQYPSTCPSYPCDPSTQDFTSLNAKADIDLISVSGNLIKPAISTPSKTASISSEDEKIEIKAITTKAYSENICEETNELSFRIEEHFQRSINNRDATPEGIKFLTTARKEGAQNFLKILSNDTFDVPIFYDLVQFCELFLLLKNANAVEDFLQLSALVKRKILWAGPNSLELTGFLRIKSTNSLKEFQLIHEIAQSTAFLNVNNFITLKKNHQINEVSQLHPNFQKAVIEYPKNYELLKSSDVLKYISPDGDLYYYITICMDPLSILQLKSENTLEFLSRQPIHVQNAAIEFPERLLFLKKKNAMENILILPPHIRHIAVLYPESFVLLYKENAIDALVQLDEKKCRSIFKNPKKFLHQKSCSETIFNRDCISRSLNPTSYI